MRQSGVADGLQEVRQANIAEHFGPDTVGDAVDDLGAILRRVDMDAERPGAEGPVDDIDDGCGNGGRIGVGRLQGGEALQRLFRNALVGTVIVFGGTDLVSRRTGMSEMVGAFGEGTGNDDRGFDAPKGEFGGIGDGKLVHRGLGG